MPHSDNPNTASDPPLGSPETPDLNKLFESEIAASGHELSNAPVSPGATASSLTSEAQNPPEPLPTNPASPAPAAPAEETPKSKAILEYLRSKDYALDPSFQSDDDVTPFLDRYAQIAEQYPQLAEEAQLGRRYAAHRDKIDAYLSQAEGKTVEPAPAPAPVADAPVAPAGWEAKPEYDARWRNYCEMDPELGQYVLKEKSRGLVDPAIADKLNRYDQWRVGAADKIVSEFPQLVQQYVPKLDGYVRREDVEQIVRQFAAQSQTQQETLSVVGQLAEHCFDKDELGRPILDPGTGKYKTSPFGDAFKSARAQLQAQGVTSIQALTQAAYASAAAVTQSDPMGWYGWKQPEAPAPEPAPNPVANGNGKNGHAPKPVNGNGRTEPQADPKESFIQRAVRDSRTPEGNRGAAVNRMREDSQYAPGGRALIRSDEQLLEAMFSEEMAAAGMSN